MADMPLIRGAFRDYTCTLEIVMHFITHTREEVAKAIKTQTFSHDLIEATCMCKYVGG